ncbi:hypothetical protein Syun_003996 [Stephania yunnanensis]|uniref:Uncharacterized protein n=1 Tax=Stephania yunnanensis TaxID=152371 RepID=A0AAP0L662_9MAGN
MDKTENKKKQRKTRRSKASPPGPPPNGFIHVRARRGEATDKKRRSLSSNFVESRSNR